MNIVLIMHKLEQHQTINSHVGCVTIGVFK